MEKDIREYTGVRKVFVSLETVGTQKGKNRLEQDTDVKTQNQAQQNIWPAKTGKVSWGS